jgi:hypothetical protein
MRGVLKRVKCPPLAKVTGERPKCQNCHKPLSPRTHSVEIVGHVNQAPSAGELAVLKQPHPTYPNADEAIKAGYEATRVYRIEHLLSWNDEPSRNCTSGVASLTATDGAEMERRHFSARRAAAFRLAWLAGTPACGSTNRRATPRLRPH